MSDVVIYTANFGGYDAPYPQHPQDITVEWVCLTDDPDAIVPHPWTAHYVDLGGEHPNLAAKRYKIQPPWFLRDEWTTAIWIDANMEIVDPAFAREAQQYVNNGIAIWAHPRRDCVYDEITVSAPGGKESQNDRYANLRLPEQAEAYRAEGMPEHAGLYASGTIVWRRGECDTISKAWLDEMERWGCFHDQLLLPVVCWRLGLEPGVFGISQVERRYTPRVTWRDRARGVPFYLANRWLRIWPHARTPHP